MSTNPLQTTPRPVSGDKAARKAETEKVAREPARHEAETEKAAVP